MGKAFNVNSYRIDPYKNFKFKVKFGEQVVAGVSKITALKKSTEPITHRDGGDESSVHLCPGTWKYEAITLERGITHDEDFEAWAAMANRYNSDADMKLKDFRKNITIELCNEQGSPAKRYHVFRCWVSEYEALPDLDANANAISIERIVIQNEGWERDTSLPEPKEN